MEKKKRKRIRITAIITAVLLIISVFVITSPEAAMLKMWSDIRSEGLTGIEPHLTGNAQVRVDTVINLVKSDLVQSIVGDDDEMDFDALIKSELKNFKFSLAKYDRGFTKVNIIIDFDYKNEVQSSVEVSVIRESGKWLIDDFWVVDADERDVVLLIIRLLKAMEIFS